MRCDVCGRTVTPDTPQCPTCGAPLVSPQTTVNRLLADAYRLFLQHRLEEAIARCVEVLRREPQNPSVPSLLGDIYSERGELEEALRWYQIAVDFNPNKTEELKKIEKIRQKLRRVNKPPSSLLTPTHFLSLGASFLGGLLLSFLFFYFVFNPSGKGPILPPQNRNNSSRTPSSQRSLPASREMGIGSSNSSSVLSALPKTAEPTPEGPYIPGETSQSPPESSLSPNYRTPPESALKSEMALGVPRERPGLVLMDVIFDTRGPKAVILLYRHLSTLSPYPWSVLLSDLYSTASWALTRDRSLQGITVKILTWVNRPPFPHFEEILICDIHRQPFLSAIPSPPPLQTVPAYCENLWWNPSVLPTPPARNPEENPR